MSLVAAGIFSLSQVLTDLHPGARVWCKATKGWTMWKTVLTITFLVLSASGALAQERAIGTYMALLGPEDLVNSSGTRLNDAAAIVAQDRANFHRFGVRHKLDESDPWFASRGHRMAIPELVEMSSRTAQVIVRQGALVAVTVFADPTGQMTRMRVEIPG